MKLSSLSKLLCSMVFALQVAFPIPTVYADEAFAYTYFDGRSSPRQITLRPHRADDGSYEFVVSRKGARAQREQGDEPSPITDNERQALGVGQLKRVRGAPVGQIGKVQRGNGSLRGAIQSAVAASRDVFIAPALENEFGLIYPTENIFVAFDPQSSIENRERLIQSYRLGSVVQHDYEDMPGLTYVVSNDRDGAVVLDRCLTASEDSEILFAEPDFVGTSHSALYPTDEVFPLQWALKNTGQKSGSQIGFDMGAVEAWDYTTGDSSIVVAILDDGIDPAHPDLNQVPGKSFTFGSSYGAPSSSCDNHGTLVAGMISAKIFNGGIVGIAPNSKVMSLKVATRQEDNPCSGSAIFTASNYVQALNTARSLGVRITNTSETIPYNSSVALAYINTMEAGLIHFAATGNDSGPVGFPASHFSVVAVANADYSGHIYPSSNNGPETELFGPGVEVWTTDRSGADGNSPNDYYAPNGTSFSSPAAAGVAALLLSINPTLTRSEVVAIMKQTATPLAPPDDSGPGLVNARAALEEVVIQPTGCPGEDPWSLRANSGPPQLEGIQMAYNSVDQAVYMFDGRSTGTNEFYDQLWKWDGQQWTLEHPGGVPGLERRDAALVYSPITDELVLFGGGTTNSDAYKHDTWVYNRNTGWTDVTGGTFPDGRWGAKLVYDSQRNKILMFGGMLWYQQTDEEKSRTWEFDPVTHQWQVLPTGSTRPDFTRNGYGFTYDSQRHKVVLFGGFAISGRHDDTWELAPQLGEWVQVASGNPGKRTGTQMVYNPYEKATILFGGLDNSQNKKNDTWKWDGTSWTRLSYSVSPAPRYNHAMALDVARNQMVMFGGLTNGSGELDTWSWQNYLPVTITQQPVNASVFEGNTAKFVVKAIGTQPLSYQWRFNGQPISDDNHYFGAQSGTLFVIGTTPDDEGIYDATITNQCQPTEQTVPVTLTVKVPQVGNP